MSTVVSLGAGSIQFAKGFGDGVLLLLHERPSDCLHLVRKRLWFRQCASLTLCCCDLNTSDNCHKGGVLCFSHTFPQDFSPHGGRVCGAKLFNSRHQASNTEEQEDARGKFTTPKAIVIHWLQLCLTSSVCHLPMAPSCHESIKSLIHSFLVRKLHDLIMYGALSPSPRPFS